MRDYRAMSLPDDDESGGQPPTGGEAEIAPRAPQWPDPSPLIPQRSSATFPTDALPAPYNDYAEALAVATQTPVDMAAVCVLGVLSAACGGRARIQPRGGWREPAHLYLLPVMAPGSRKSAVIAAVTRPLFTAEQALVDRHGPAARESLTLREIAEKQAKEAQSRAARATPENQDAANAEAIAAAETAATVTVPPVPRILADDITPEAVSGLLCDQGGRIAVVSAEGGVFDVMAGRYSNGLPNLDVWLKGHAGDPIRVDRRGRPPERVDAPAVTLLLTVQPAVLAAIARNGAFVGRGLLARVLFSIPPSNIGFRTPAAPPVPDELEQLYHAKAATLTETMAAWEDPALLTMTADAADAVKDMERWIEPRLAPRGEYGGIVDWAAKWVGAVLRIAALLHLAEHGETGTRIPVTADTVERARRIGMYFLEHARNAFALLGQDPQTSAASAVLELLQRQRLAAFKVRDVQPSLPRSHFADADDVYAAVAVLEEHGWVRQLPQPRPSGPGRPPTPRWEVHPSCRQ